MVSSASGGELNNTLTVLIELTTAYTKEFARETEAMTWFFAFPILLTFTLPRHGLLKERVE